MHIVGKPLQGGLALHAVSKCRCCSQTPGSGQELAWEVREDKSCIEQVELYCEDKKIEAEDRGVLTEDRGVEAEDRGVLTPRALQASSRSLLMQRLWMMHPHDTTKDSTRERPCACSLALMPETHFLPYSATRTCDSGMRNPLQLNSELRLAPQDRVLGFWP